MSKTNGGASTPAKDSRDVLVPKVRDVPISDGSTVQVKPWSIKLLVEISRRVPDKFEELFTRRDPTTAIVAILEDALAEFVYLVSATTGTDEKTVQEKWTAEDLLDVAQATLEICVEPLAKKMQGLFQRFMTVVDDQTAAMNQTRTPTRGSRSAAPLSS